MTNELLEEMLHNTPLAWGLSPKGACLCEEDECLCQDFKWADAEEVLEQCDLGDTTCEACQ